MDYPLDSSPEALRQNPSLAELETNLDEIYELGASAAKGSVEFQLSEEMVARLMDRRTDDPMHNRNILRQWYDVESDSFDPRALSYVYQQALSELAEADVHALGAPITHRRDADGKWASFLGTLEDNARAGVEALDPDDEMSRYEVMRRIEEEVEAIRNNSSERQSGFKRGDIAVFISPKGTHSEIDPDVAQTFNYDDRDMLRLHAGSPDGDSKTMYSFSVFNVPIEGWTALASSLTGRPVDTRALSVMEASNAMSTFDQFEGTQGFLGFARDTVLPFVEDAYVDNVEAQFDNFINQQDKLLEDVEVYVQERVCFEQDMARSDQRAVGLVKSALHSLYANANEERQRIIDAHRLPDGEFRMSEELSLAIWQLKVVTNFNRAGVALENQRTVQRLRFSAGQDFVDDLYRYELETIRMFQDGQLDFETMMSRAQQADEYVSQTNLTCGGGCTVEIANDVNDPLGSNKARRLGLKGTLYRGSELNKKSGCCLSPDVRADGKNKACINCGATTVDSKATAKKDDKAEKPTFMERQRGVNPEEASGQNSEEQQVSVSTLEARRAHTEAMQKQFGVEGQDDGADEDSTAQVAPVMQDDVVLAA